ncbi:helix-turn-helix domain-containing protein [Burkholderia ambifaria]|uniref:helix-turn-helix domain-containing protein n=1 Tax=Burkholderia ambifaria TaxID=152480 RepID=UPI00158E97C5
MQSHIGDRLREERVRLGLSQEDFGAIGGVKKLAQGNYEKGMRVPDAAYLAAIAAAGVDVLYVVTGTRAVPIESTLSRDEEALLDNYRHSAPDGQAAVRRTASALAQSRKKNDAAA